MRQLQKLFSESPCSLYALKSLINLGFLSLGSYALDENSKAYKNNIGYIFSYWFVGIILELFLLCPLERRAQNEQIPKWRKAVVLFALALESALSGVFARYSAVNIAVAISSALVCDLGMIALFLKFQVRYLEEERERLLQAPALARARPRAPQLVIAVHNARPADKLVKISLAEDSEIECPVERVFPEQAVRFLSEAGTFQDKENRIVTTETAYSMSVATHIFSRPREEWRCPCTNLSVTGWVPANDVREIAVARGVKSFTN